MLCNTLEENGVRPEKVLRKAGLAGAEWNAPAAVTALLSAAHTYFTDSVPATVTRTKTMTRRHRHSASDYDSKLSLLFMGCVQVFFFSVFFLFMLPLVSYVEGTSLYTSLRYQADADA
jgi:hypothetical protein